ncbi:hypothetical protein ACMFMG_009292 [Clarireedia jacksonii]
MDSDGFYQYSKIAAAGEIRLLLLQPGTDVLDVVKCSLTYTTLKECEYDIVNHYIALSYVWGDQTDIRMIYIDEKPFFITASLECALRYVRDDSNVLRIWADGICVDQSSDEDRSQ